MSTELGSATHRPSVDLDELLRSLKRGSDSLAPPARDGPAELVSAEHASGECQPGHGRECQHDFGVY